MTLELIVFIGAVLFGILIYWRESQGNGIYRFFNKLFNTKELQMKPDNKKGFVFQQGFLLRLVFISFLFLVGITITRFLIPIDLATISIFASCIVGTLIGTYVGAFVLKSGEVIEKQSETFEGNMNNTISRSREIFDDFKNRDTKNVEVSKEEIVEEPIKHEKTARERLKDKGLM